MDQHKLFVVLVWILAVLVGFMLGRIYKMWRSGKGFGQMPEKQAKKDLSQYKNLYEVQQKLDARRARKMEKKAKASADYGKISSAARTDTSKTQSK